MISFDRTTFSLCISSYDVNVNINLLLFPMTHTQNYIFVVNHMEMVFMSQFKAFYLNRNHQAPMCHFLRQQGQRSKTYIIHIQAQTN